MGLECRAVGQKRRHRILSFITGNPPSPSSYSSRLPLLPPPLQSFVGRRRSRREPSSPSWSLSLLLFFVASSLQCVLPLVVVSAVIVILLVFPAPLPQFFTTSPCDPRLTHSCRRGPHTGYHMWATNIALHSLFPHHPFLQGRTALWRP